MVLGAGLAGLSAARDLARAGARVSLVDGSERLGGLASSVEVGGERVERFYHFICRGDDELLDLADELGLESEIHWHQGGTAFYYQGRLYPFSTPFDLLRFSPVPLSQRLRFGATITRSRFRSHWEPLDGVSARK